MATFSITQPHQMTLAEARSAAQTVADELANKFAMTCNWVDNLMTFQRVGVSGTLALHPTEARLDVELGIMLAGFSSMMEEKLARKMKTVFAG